MWLFVVYIVALELPANQANISGVQSTPGVGGQEPQQTGGENSLLMQIVGLICGTVCKDTPLADFIPPPTEASQTMNHYNGTLNMDMTI